MRSLELAGTPVGSSDYKSLWGLPVLRSQVVTLICAKSGPPIGQLLCFKPFSRPTIENKTSLANVYA
jgi:hypothetical protein